MTTKPLSSRRNSPRSLAVRLDGLPIQLGSEIGRGGEGAVFEIDGQPSLVAKVYHQLPLSSETITKLEAVVACRSPSLDAISAWPQAVLTDERDQPCGILMPRIADSRHLHELYGTYNRRRYFPEAKWHHLLLAARNVAAAFHLLHSAGIVVGDVNQGNLMVDQGMCIRFIDCDSFQISSGETVFRCPVGTPHFTPPELQEKMLRDFIRTPDHDRFGVAILIFHLLFVGRHPYAGRYRGSQELSIEKAIAERRFAFSANKKATLVDPPPASLLLDDLPQPLAELFEWVFCGRSDQDGRPSAQQWVDCLDRLIQRRRICSFDVSHVFFDQLNACPWCRVEDEGGPAFFLGGDAISIVSEQRLAALDKKIQKLKVRGFPELHLNRLSMPRVLPLEKPASTPKFSSCDLSAAVFAVSAIVCVLGAVFPVPLIAGTSLIAGTTGVLLGGGMLLFSKEGRDRRKQLSLLSQRLTQIQDKLSKWSRAVVAQHRRRKSSYDSSLAEVKLEGDHYKAEGKQLQDVLVLQRGAQKERFLTQHLIRDNVPRIPGMSFSLVSMLESFGVESALDIDRLKLTGIPIMGPSLTMELMNWREQVEATFSFNPEHGITFKDLKSAEELAVRQFKAAQAKRVLIAAKQLDSLAEVGLYELDRAVKRYNDLAAQGHDVVTQIKDFQSGRRRLERSVNRSWRRIFGLAVGVPLLGLLLYLLFRFLVP